MNLDITRTCYNEEKGRNEALRYIQVHCVLLNNIPSIAILNKKTHLTISVIDAFNGNFFKAYEILDMNLPLKPVVHKVKEVLTEGIDTRLETLTLTSTTYTPQARMH